MKEKAQEILYKSYLDFGLIVVIAVAAVVGFWFLLKYTKTMRDKYILEKEKEIIELKLENNKYKEQISGMTEIIKRNNEVLAENSSALHEVKGVLLMLKNK